MRTFMAILGVLAYTFVCSPNASAQTASPIKAADVPAPKFAIEKGASLRMLRSRKQWMRCGRAMAALRSRMR